MNMLITAVKPRLLSVPLLGQHLACFHHKIPVCHLTVLVCKNGLDSIAEGAK
jgi:hypothetical protein